MRDNKSEVLAHFFATEGGYSDNPHDPGGPTKYGITIYDARKYGAEFGWIAHPTAADIRDMPKAFAMQVLSAKYWDAVRGDDLPSGLDYSVADYGLNSGVSRAIKVLQRLVDVTADGELGPISMAAVVSYEPANLINAVATERLAFLKSLHTWPVFGRGWAARVASVRAISLHMAADAMTPRPVAVKPEITAKAYDIQAIAA